MGEATIKAFIERWQNSGAAERANCQIFLSELCTLLDVPPPEPTTPDTSLNAYVFEREVAFRHGLAITRHCRTTGSHLHPRPGTQHERRALCSRINRKRRSV